MDIAGDSAPIGSERCARARLISAGLVKDWAVRADVQWLERGLGGEWQRRGGGENEDAEPRAAGGGDSGGESDGGPQESECEMSETVRSWRWADPVEDDKQRALVESRSGSGNISELAL